ncbi:MAG TPA: prepilin-type N-terminal cleavage/methylation domain-containing protein [Verrucomicrobiae bacterium]|nr:prepilin-type N-terminal cleavage/methylation domain-containing protein [Verrucomicrobiae bacterium]
MKFRLPNQKRRSAFTLMELMVVCVLIAILAAVMIPEMRGSYQDAQLRATSRKVMDALDLAYSRAVTLDQEDRVRLDTRAGRYVIEWHVEEQGQDSFEALKDVAGAAGELDKRISIEVRNASEDSTNETSEAMPSVAAGADQIAENTISFYSDGTADDREVILRDPEGFRVGLQINPITARVKVIELERR